MGMQGGCGTHSALTPLPNAVTVQSALPSLILEPEFLNSV